MEPSKKQFELVPLPRPVAISMVLYQGLLELFPPDYQFRDALTVTFEEECCEAYVRDWWRLVAVWLWAVGWDLPSVLCGEWVETILRQVRGFYEAFDEDYYKAQLDYLTLFAKFISGFLLLISISISIISIISSNSNIISSIGIFLLLFLCIGIGIGIGIILSDNT